MEEEKYTFNELILIKTAISKLIQYSKTTAVDKRLLYALAKNLTSIDSELKIMKDQLTDYPEGYEKYIGKLQDIALNCGGKESADQYGNRTVNLPDDQYKKNEFEEKANDLKDEHKELIAEVEKVDQANEHFLNEQLSDWKPYRFKLDFFPEEITLDVMPFELLELIDND